MTNDSKSMTNFEMVGEFHQTFGHPKYNTEQRNMFDTASGLDLLRKRYGYIEEEYDEMHEAIEKKDLPEVADALCDAIYFLYGTGHVMGVNLDVKLEENLRNKFSVTSNEFNELTNFGKTAFVYTQQKNLPYNSNKFVPKWNVFESDPNLLVSQLEYLYDGLLELKESFESKKFDEIINDLVCLLENTYCTGYLLGLDIDKFFKEVHTCNMTKVCDSEELAQQTVQSYKEDKDNKYKDPRYRASGKYFIVYDHSTSKILKSLNWREPKLETLMK